MLSLVIITIISGISLLGLVLIPPVIPWLIAPLNATESNIGLIMAVFTLPQIFTAPLLGLFADQYDRKKILIFCLVIYAFSGSAIAWTNSFVLVLLLRAIQGSVCAAFYVLTLTFIGDIYTGNQRKQANGILSMVNNGFGIIIPIIGGYLAFLNWRYPFLVYSVAFLVAILVWKAFKTPSSSRLPIAHTTQQSKYQQIKKGIQIMRKWRTALALYASLMLFGLNMGILFTYYPIYVESLFGATQVMIGSAQAIMFTTSMGSSLLYGVIAKKVSPSIIGLLAFSSYVLGFAGIVFSVQFSDTILALAINGIGFGLLIPLINNEILESTPPEIRATETALYQSVIRIGQTIFPIGFGLLLSVSGNILLLFPVAILLGSSVILLYALDLIKDYQKKMILLRDGDLLLLEKERP